jgi:hypothetical protein
MDPHPFSEFIRPLSDREAIEGEGRKKAQSRP